MSRVVLDNNKDEMSGCDKSPTWLSNSTNFANSEQDKNGANLGTAQKAA